MISEINKLKEFYRYPVTPGSYFISFEGIEGSGKSTQIKLIEESLRQKNFNVTTLREPGGTKFGEKLREAILESKVPLHPLAECHLFLASRAQLLKEKVLPLLLQPGHVVILDRYMDSTLAYQGKARRLGYDVVLNLHKNDPLNLMPHRTYFLDISLEASMHRQAVRGQHKDYFESENHQFYSELIQGYRDMANLFPERILKIDATKSMNDVQSLIQADLEQFLK
jgi:dTMP kinase